MGPKPSVVIDFKGLEDENYYVTLLSKTDSTGPYSAITKGPGYTMYESGDEDYDVFLKFAGYEDGDGYYFLQYFKNCGDSHRFAWTYYPPVNFKILVYFPDYDAFAVSAEAYERYAFDSYYSVSVSGAPETVTQPYRQNKAMIIPRRPSRWWRASYLPLRWSWLLPCCLGTAKKTADIHRDGQCCNPDSA